MTDALYSLAYTSEASRKIETKDLVSILLKSTEKNSRDDLTGVLLYRDNKFFQILEGPEDKVLKLMKTISGDARHTNVKVDFRCDLSVRLFPQWAMGGEHAPVTEGFQSFIRSRLERMYTDGAATPEQINQLKSALRFCNDGSLLESGRDFQAGSDE